MRRVKIESARAPCRSPEPAFPIEAPPARGGRRRPQRDAERQLRRLIGEPSRRRGESATQKLSFQFLVFGTACAFSNSFRQSCASDSSESTWSVSANATPPCSARIPPELPCALKLPGLRRRAFWNSARA